MICLILSLSTHSARFVFEQLDTLTLLSFSFFLAEFKKQQVHTVQTLHERCRRSLSNRVYMLTAALICGSSDEFRSHQDGWFVSV